MATDLIVRLAEMPEKPEFTKNDEPFTFDKSETNQTYLGNDSRFRGGGRRLRHFARRHGPADKAGLKQGDVIVRLGDEKIDGLEAMHQALGKFKPGQQTELEFRRDGQTQTVTVTLGKRS